MIVREARNRSLAVSLLAVLAGCAVLPEAPRPTHGLARDEALGRGERVAERERERDAEERIAPDAPDAFTEFQLARRLPADGVLPMDALSRAQAHRAAMPQYSTALGRPLPPGIGLPKAAADWQWLGPANIAGRGRTLAFDPRDPRRMYTAGVSGGVWRSDDAGANWAPLSDGAENINIGSLVIDPVEPDTLYAGTGELYRNSVRPYSAMWGQGILRSRDGGHTFQPMTATANDDFRYVADLAISAHDHRRLYAATNSGIWLSRDGGAHFERLLYPSDDDGGPRYEGCNDLQLLPGHDGDYLLATCSSRSTSDRYWRPGSVTPPACGQGPCPAAIWVNADAAGSGQWQMTLSESGMGRTTIAIVPSQTDALYAVSASIAPGFDRNGDGVGDYENGLHALWHSDDGGLSWQARLRNDSSDALSTYLFNYADGMEAPRCDFGGFYNYAAGWYNQAIAVDPLDPDTVWVAGMDVYRSDDGGRSFGIAGYWWQDGVSPAGIHSDQHFLAFSPGFDGVTDQRLYAVNDGGVWRTDQARGAISRGIGAACGPSPGVLGWTPLTHGLGTVQYYSGTTTADGSRYLAGAQDNGTHLGGDAAGTAGWQHIFGGDGTNVAIDPRDPDRLYVSSQFANIHRSETGGRSFVDASNGLIDAPLFVMPYVLDMNAPDRLWAGASRMWRSDDRGAHWRSASTLFGTEYEAKVSAIAVAPGNSNRVLAANRYGIYRNDAATSATGGTTWSRVSPRDGWVSSLVFDPHDADVVYATYSTFGGVHVWKSSDGGRQWQPLDGSDAASLPDIAVHTLAVDPGDPARLFVGTDLGLYVSTDGGAHWAAENNGFASVIVEKLSTTSGVGGRPPMLYAFTYGRGAWRVPLTQLTGQADYRIDDRLSGAFYAPDQNGHGWLLESLVLDGVRQVLAGWYVYRDGEPLWLIGVAPVSGGSVEIPLTSYRGGQFPPAFDPADLQATAWGTLRFEFDDADHGRASWSTTLPGYGSGAADIVRLTGIDSGDDPTTPSGCHSGSWFQPSQSGHGLQVEVLDDGAGGRQLLAVWYHFIDGAPAWLLGVGPVDGDHADLEMRLGRGAGFPPAFDPADVELLPWGTLRFTVLGADQARIDWDAGVEGYGDGSLDLVRLTGLAGHGCRAP